MKCELCGSELTRIEVVTPEAVDAGEGVGGFPETSEVYECQNHHFWRISPDGKRQRVQRFS